MLSRKEGTASPTSLHQTVSFTWMLALTSKLKHVRIQANSSWELDCGEHTFSGLWLPLFQQLYWLTDPFTIMSTKYENYDPVPDNYSEDGSPRPPEARRQRRNLADWLPHPAVPWTLTLVFFTLSLLLAMYIDQNLDSQHCQQPNSSLGSFETGYTTDFVTARKHIHASQTRFTGSPSFHSNGSMFNPNPDPVLYVGNPVLHPEIDWNWDNLTYSRYVLITKEEALASWPDVEEIEQYWDKQRGGYVAGFDVFHTLHCLNNIRKELNPQFYPPSTLSHHHKARSSSLENARMHQDHCIEQIRQYVMCSGDMTPIPTRFYPSLGRNYVNSDVKHTCRDIESLRRWMVERY